MSSTPSSFVCRHARACTYAYVACDDHDCRAIPGRGEARGRQDHPMIDDSVPSQYLCQARAGRPWKSCMHATRTLDRGRRACMLAGAMLQSARAMAMPRVQSASIVQRRSCMRAASALAHRIPAAPRAARARVAVQVGHLHAPPPLPLATAAKAAWPAPPAGWRSPPPTAGWPAQPRPPARCVVSCCTGTAGRRPCCRSPAPVYCDVCSVAAPSRAPVANSPPVARPPGG